MKKLLALVLALCMVFTLLAGCGSGKDDTAVESPDTSEGIGIDKPEMVVPTDSGIAEPDNSETPGTSEEPVEKEATGLVIYEEYLAEKVTLAISGNATSLVPWGRAVFGQAEARNIIFQKLLRGDIYGTAHLEVAKEIIKEDDLTYRIILWEGIYDSAGNAFTANDVVFSMERYKSTGNKGYISKFDHFEVISDTELIWHCKEPFGLGEMVDQMSCFNLVTQKSFEASEDGMVLTPVGTGPYKVKSYTPGSVLVLEVDENFWMRNLPEEAREELWIYNYQNVREIEYQSVVDSSQRAIALEMGTVDVVDDIAEVDLLTFANNPDFEPVYTLNRPPATLLFNCSEDSVCSDINLRKAICYAIDNAAIVAGIGDYAYEVYGFMPYQADSPEEWRTGREYYDYDAAKAAELLKAAGYNNEPITIMYAESSSGISYEEVAVLLQAQLKKAGLNVTLRGADVAVNSVDRFDGSKWDIRMDIFGGGDFYVNVMQNFWSGAYEEDLDGKTLMLIEEDKLDQLYAELAANPVEETINAYDEYFSFEQCYGYGVVGAYLRTVSKANVEVALGDRGTLMVPNAFTFTE